MYTYCGTNYLTLQLSATLGVGVDGGSPVANGTGDAKRARHDTDGVGPAGKASWAVSPVELREALTALGKAAFAAKCDMHDAAEVYQLNMFSSLRFL